MTERPATAGRRATAGRPAAAGPPAAAGRPAAAQRRPAVPWLARNPLAVIAAALASFLVVLVLLTARVVSGQDPALRAPSAAVVVSQRGHRALRTTASGRVVAVGAGGASAAPSARPAGIVTRTSGAPGGGGLRDE